MRLTALLAALAAILALSGSAASGAPATTLKVELFAGLDATDPALSYTVESWQMHFATCVKLYNYPDAAAPAGMIPQPEAAVTEPTVSRDGETYTFVVPPGRFRFAPPSNEKVTAASFKRAFERALAPGTGSPALTYASVIEGALAYAAGSAPSISGLELKGAAQLTIRLTQPAPDLPQRLALPFFCAVPTDAPPVSPTSVVPGAGPYTITSVVPAGSLTGTVTLERNPSYKGRRPSGYDRIELTLSPDRSTTLDRVTSGAVGYATGLPVAQYGTFPRPDAKLEVNPSLSLRYIRFNTARPLFASASARKAASLALDRTALATVGGPFAHIPTDQLLPPGMPGFVDQAIVPFGPPDAARLAEAQALLGASVPATAELYALNNPGGAAFAAMIQAQLAPLGITVNVHLVPFGVLNALPPPFTWDIVLNGWAADYDDPFNVINVLLGPGEPLNIGGFLDPVLSPAMGIASQLGGDARSVAYADLDLRLSRDAVPMAPFANLTARDVFSLAVGCQTYSPPFGMDLAALCPLP